MRVLVCGGRDFTDSVFVGNTLLRIEDERGGFTSIIHGGAHGADSEAGAFAERHKIKVVVFKANWKRDGKMAGPIRNERMLVEGKPDLVVAFPGGRGTADCVRRAKDFGIEVIQIPNPHQRLVGCVRDARDRHPLAPPPPSPGEPMSKIDEMVETFLDGASFLRNSVAREAAHAGLRAVLEKHVKAMVADAFRNGIAFETDQRQPNSYIPRITPEMYAERVISGEMGR